MKKSKRQGSCRKNTTRTRRHAKRPKRQKQQFKTAWREHCKTTDHEDIEQQEYPEDQEYLEHQKHLARIYEKYREEEQKEHQRNAGRLSGQARRIRTADRDKRIRKMNQNGHSQRKIAEAIGTSPATINRVLKQENGRA